MVNKINTFLDSLPKSSKSLESSENSEILESSDSPDISSNKELKEDE